MLTIAKYIALKPCRKDIICIGCKCHMLSALKERIWTVWPGGPQFSVERSSRGISVQSSWGFFSILDISGELGIPTPHMHLSQSSKLSPLQPVVAAIVKPLVNCWCSLDRSIVGAKLAPLLTVAHRRAPLGEKNAHHEQCQRGYYFAGVGFEW